MAHIDTAQLQEIETALTSDTLDVFHDLPAQLHSAGLVEVARVLRILLESDSETAPIWWPAEAALPDLLGELEHMETNTVDSRIIQLYKHTRTRGYICLDTDGQPWDVTADPATGRYTGQPTTMAAARAQLLRNNG